MQNKYIPIVIVILVLIAGGGYYFSKQSVPNLQPTGPATTSTQNTIATFTINVVPSGDTQTIDLNINDDGKTMQVGVGAYIYFSFANINAQYIVDPASGVIGEVPSGIYNLPNNVSHQLRAVGVGTATITVKSSNITAGWKTYKDSQYGFGFKYPTNYTVDKTVGSYHCDNLTVTQASCLATLSIMASPSNYAPQASFYLVKGINSVKITSQMGGATSFDPQRKVWVGTPDFPERVLSIWGRAASGQDIIQAGSFGSQASQYHYLIPDYQKDVVAIFTIPKSYRERCDLISNISQQTQCNNFYNSVIQKYNGGKVFLDTILPDSYLSALYKDAGTMVKSFSLTSQ